MNRRRRIPLIFFCLASLAGPFVSPAQAIDSSERSPRLLVHLLDYLAVDYGGAVQNGKILSASEYREQLEFVKTSMELSQTLPEVKSSAEIKNLVNRLNALIQSKAGPEQVSAAARQAQAKVIQFTGLSVAPDQWPNLSSGKQLFQNTCAKCHGMEGRGDGPSSVGLETKPADFQNMAKMKQMTPFQVFNTVRLGVPGTPMAAFPAYSDQDTWNLAFYILSMRFQKTPVPDAGMVFAQTQTQLRMKPAQFLTLAATSPESEMEKKITGRPEQIAAALAALRLHTSGETAQASLDFARANIQDALTDYQARHYDSASKRALSAYVEGVEPIEPRLRANDPEAVSNLEQLMGTVRAVMNDRKPVEIVENAVQSALDSLQKCSDLLNQQAPSPELTFTLAAGVLIREGFEAVLLIVALLGVIRASGAQKARRWVHGGWLAAVALGVAAWFFSGWLMNISGIGRELMEGITGVLTVLILLYIGFWLHSRTEIHRWKTFIEVQVKSAVEEKNLIQLAFISFLAAFREAIETVLFLRAIWLEGGSETKTALGLGVIGAFAVILILGWLLLNFSAKIPIKTLFNISSAVMILLAVILTGKAFHSFQEIDLISITPSPLNLRFDWFGIYPTLETAAAQWVVLLLSAALWFIGKRPPKGAKTVSR